MVFCKHSYYFNSNPIRQQIFIVVVVVIIITVLLLCVSRVDALHCCYYSYEHRQQCVVVTITDSKFKPGSKFKPVTSKQMFRSWIPANNAIKMAHHSPAPPEKSPGPGPYACGHEHVACLTHQGGAQAGQPWGMGELTRLWFPVPLGCACWSAASRARDGCSRHSHSLYCSAVHSNVPRTVCSLSCYACVAPPSFCHACALRFFLRLSRLLVGG